MDQTKWISLAAALAIMAGTRGLLAYAQAHQRLGRPGVTTRPLAEGRRVHVELPERVLDYSSREVEMDKVVVDFLPPDTSFGQRFYTAPDGSEVRATVVLMGADRTSLHKPEYCLLGSGWRIDEAKSAEEKVRIERPRPYDLPVMKLVTTMANSGQDARAAPRALYVYWFVADGEYTARHSQRMWWMARDLLRTGVLQRWAYVSCLAACPPGEEGPAFERMKKFIAAAVPQFQLTPGVRPGP
jgi:hypothetical protein